MRPLILPAAEQSGDEWVRTILSKALKAGYALRMIEGRTGRIRSGQVRSDALSRSASSQRVGRRRFSIAMTWVGTVT